MRARAVLNGTLVKAYAGSTGVLLAFDVEPERREGLLGFAVERSGGGRETQFLTGLLGFPDSGHEPGTPISTASAPVQKFRWSDYRVFPDLDYTYTVHPVTGTPAAPVVEDGPTVTVRTASTATGTHRVLFNRAAAASQAFTKQFPEVSAELDTARREKREPVLPARALAWLSRGVLEQIVGFCNRALDESWALDVAIYEYELSEIVAAVNAARDRGAAVRIVYHARPGDEQTAANEANLAGWPPENLRARTTSKIFHDKFVVLSRHHRIAGPAAGPTGDPTREPVSVLCGSTNFTANGVYRQANVVHIAELPDLAATYLATFDEVFAGADVAATRDWIDHHNPLPALGDPRPVWSGFSPRSGKRDLDLFAAEIASAGRDVLFCTAFDIDDRLEAALLGAEHDDILRLGLQNKASGITGTHRDRTADFVATALMNDGLEGWQRESMAGQKGGILIHTKLVVVDFTSDAPTVISGSHNLSGSASHDNDENYLILRGDTDLADNYGVEALRLYEHYRTRWHLTHPDDATDPPQRDRKPNRKRDGDGDQGRRLELVPDDSWTQRYFQPDTLPSTDRERFAGPWPSA